MRCRMQAAMKATVLVLGSGALAGCNPALSTVPAGQDPPGTTTTTLAELGHEPPLDPNLVYDDDPGMACYPTDIRTGEVVDVCVYPFDD